MEDSQNMFTRFERGLWRRLAPLAAAGVLLQTAGCQTTTLDLINGLIVSSATNLINGIIFGAFGLAP